MNLDARYLGFELKHPIIPGASPLTGDVSSVTKLEDAGAPMIVMPSLFEEQIETEQHGVAKYIDPYAESYGEAGSYLPEPDHFRIGADDYLEKIRKIKERVSIPVVGSLNGTTEGGWTRYARLIQEAGADALELNLYEVATNADTSSLDREHKLLRFVDSVVKTVSMPIAIKLSPFFTSLPHFARELDLVGAKGILVFNRFYQPDFDLETMTPQRKLSLSSSSELLLRLHGCASLFGLVQCDLAITGGVHRGVDVVKALMSGASVVQTVSSLLLRGPEHLVTLVDELKQWMESNEYDSVDQMIGSMSLKNSTDPHAFERLNYIELLQSWRP